MAEILDLTDDKDPRNVQRKIKQRRQEWEAAEHAKSQGVGVLRGFTDDELLTELERRHPQGSGSERYGTDSWPETVGRGLSDDTSKVPTQADADAVAAQAAAEEAQRKATATA